MAITSVKGSVTRIFHKGLGAEVTESWEARGERMSRRWSCWFEAEHGFSEGQQVEVSGMHSDQVDAWETKEGETRHTVKRSIQKARVVKATEAQEAPVDSWSASTSYKDETPF